MSTAVPIQSLVNMTATLASQQTHAHHGTQSSAVNPVHCITDGFDERDWDAVTLLYHTHIKTLRLREREQQGRELVQSVLSNMGPGEAGLRQLAAVNLLMLSKPRSPRKARSCTGRGTAKPKAKSRLVPAATAHASNPSTPVARRTRSRSSKASSACSTSGSSQAQ